MERYLGSQRQNQMSEPSKKKSSPALFIKKKKSIYKQLFVVRKEPK